MKTIVWLASYPKSGNTWFRVFLANLLRQEDEPVDINRLGGTAIASARGLFDAAVGVEAGDLTATEILRLRPRVYEAWAAAAEGVRFHKIHDAYGYTPAGEPMVSTAATRGALYFVRNPLDVCVSYANHNHCSVEQALAIMEDEAHALADRPGCLSNQLAQPLSTWSGHVRSWTEQRDVPVHVLRYEDMKARPLETFTAALRFAGLDQPEEEIAVALERSAFERLQQQESAAGFREKMRKVGRFFRRGEVGNWRDDLTEEQAARLVAAHGEVMRRFGYLSADGQVLV